VAALKANFSEQITGSKNIETGCGVEDGSMLN
jgi:hypothetical protein